MASQVLHVFEQHALFDKAGDDGNLHASDCFA